jgi:UDP-N-acetyl-D-glucosamine dehydrogenase
LTDGTNLKIGEDLFLAFSPERVDPGRADYTTINTPKVIGGITPACLEVTSCWYGQALQKVVPYPLPKWRKWQNCLKTPSA